MKNETFADGLRKLADRIEASSEELAMGPQEVTLYAWTPKEMVRFHKAIGGEWKKEVTDYAFKLVQPVGEHSIRIFMAREAACKKVVVSTEKVMVPDPNFQVPMIEVEVDVTEWDCTPSLLELVADEERELEVAE